MIFIQIIQPYYEVNVKSRVRNQLRLVHIHSFIQLSLQNLPLLQNYEARTFNVIIIWSEKYYSKPAVQSKMPLQPYLVLLVTKWFGQLALTCEHCRITAPGILIQSLSVWDFTQNK